jgi:hypothetical protein
MVVVERMVRAFPRAMAREAEAAAKVLVTLGATLSPDGFTVVVGTDLVTIPDRLYVEEQTAPAAEDGLIACLFTRHHDGFVRQRALERVLRLETPWAVPFIVRLVGEYVIEIIGQIDDRFTDLPVEHLTAFVKANPDFMRLTHARVTSYWNWYYRDVPCREYVGFRLMERIEAAAAS